MASSIGRVLQLKSSSSCPHHVVRYGDHRLSLSLLQIIVSIVTIIGVIPLINEMTRNRLKLGGISWPLLPALRFHAGIPKYRNAEKTRRSVTSDSFLIDEEMKDQLSGILPAQT